MKVQSIAEDQGMDVSDSSDLEWKIKEVREAVNALESALYDLVEPFEDALRDKNNEIDDLEFELEEHHNVCCKFSRCIRSGFTLQGTDQCTGIVYRLPSV